MYRHRSEQHLVRRSQTVLSWLMLSLMLMVGLTLAGAKSTFAALPPAGTTIGNQASATYTDETGTARNATSNTVITVVNQVGAFTLEADRNKNAAPNSTVYFSHTVTNIGNGPDKYVLGAVDDNGDFIVGNIVIYADENGDGVPDNFTPITETDILAAGESFSFVVAGLVSSSATPGQTGKVEVKATSDFDGTEITNDDTVTVSENAIVDITKAIDKDKGTSDPQSTHTYTLTYTNNGIGAATALAITDVLDSHLTYVADSGTWSQLAGGGNLTDNANEQAGNGAATIDYNVSGQTIDIVVSNVAPGETGKITFDVQVNAGTEPQVIPNVATYEYVSKDGGADPDVTNQSTNKVNLTIDPTAGVEGESNPQHPDPDDSTSHKPVPQGSTLYFINEFTNTGTGADTFDVVVDLSSSSYPAGTTFKLYKPNSAGDGPSAPLTDTNGNGIPDTGSVAPGESYNVILQVTLPANANGDNSGAGFSVDKTATSNVDPDKSATVTDKLKEITPSTVDLQNPGETSSGGHGVGQGPEANPVDVQAGDPGTKVLFELSVTNTSAVSDNYDLLASGSSTFDPSPTTLPSDVQVIFRADNGGVPGGIITNTGNVIAGSTVTFWAEVSIPADAAPATEQDIYFQSKSPNTGALDQKLDAITINEVRGITIEPNHTGQTYPGNSITYSHTVTNEGNTSEEIELSLTDDSSGFTSLIYEDTNGNGILDQGEPQITAPFTLGPGESKDIIVKVFAPANAVPGNVNVTDVVAETTDGDLTDNATDATTVVSGQLTLQKEQADGDKPHPWTYTENNLDLDPGAIIRYKITVTNNSAAPITDVVVNDTTPSYTTYNAGDSSTNSDAGVAVWVDKDNQYHAGSPIVTPAGGSSGVLVFSIGTLDPGESATIYFGVKIDE